MKIFNQSSNRKLIFLLIISLIIFQLILFLIYENYNRYTEQNDLKNLLIQQNITLIQRIKASKSPAEIIKNIHIPNTNITLTQNPIWPIKNDSSSLWMIYGKMKHQINTVRISVQIAANKWLNIEIIPSVTHSIASYFFVIFEIVTTLFLIMLFWISYRHTLPLREIAAAAKRLSSDINTQPLQVKGPIVARDAFQSINDMQTKINNLIHERTLMLAAISHDLRTPLTSLRLRTELIENPEYSEKNHKNLDEMEEMIAQILDFTKEDYLLEQKFKFDLTTLVTSICHDYLDRGKIVKYIGLDNKRIIFNGSLLSLKRAFSNIIDNAIKYGGSAEVNLFLNNGINFVVRDFGPGISNDHKDKVFIPFYRVESSRTGKKSGVGLGLAIARNIISAHGGVITLDQVQPSGLQASIILPLSH